MVVITIVVALVAVPFKVAELVAIEVATEIAIAVTIRGQVARQATPVILSEAAKKEAIAVGTCSSCNILRLLKYG